MNNVNKNNEPSIGRQVKMGMASASLSAGTSQSETKSSVDQSGTITWTIPIEITVSMPELNAQVKAPAGAASGASVEGRFSSSSPATDFGGFEIGSVLTDQFSWPTAFSMALASKLAYEGESVVAGNAVNDWGFSQCRFVDIDDTQCFLAVSDEFVTLSFRGTENLGDWLANLNMRSTTRDYGKVHRGFLGAFQVVKQDLEELLREFDDRPLILTGHSLGGALATIAAAEWQGKFPISSIYTFGQPGVGKRNFPNFINRNYDGGFFRFVNDDDIVPRVPPTYRHVGELFHFDSWGNLKNSSGRFLESAAEAKAGVDMDMMSEAEFDVLRLELLAQTATAKGANVELPSSSLAEGLLPSVSDHGMDKYIKKIRRMI